MLGSLISAGSSLLGGLFGKSSADKANKFAKDSAQKSIQWRVADAKKAGVSPIYALGAPTMSVGGMIGESPLGNALSDMGQNIGRAVNATTSSQGRFDEQLRQLQLKRASLENDLLASQIANLNQAGRMPAAPGTGSIIPGQGDVPLIEAKPPSRTSHFVTPTGKVVKTYALPDAQVYQDRYGEVAENIYGVRNWLYDNFPEVMKFMQRPVKLKRPSGRWPN